MPDTILRWAFSARDMRNCTATITYNSEDTVLYYFETDLTAEEYAVGLGYETVWYRTNLRLMRKERAGIIKWKHGGRMGSIELGKRTPSFHKLAEKKKATSRSRRFPGSDGKEYKWRPTGDKERDLECLPVSILKKPPVAYWSIVDQSLRVTEAGEPIMDDIVATLLMHLFRRREGVDLPYPKEEEKPEAVAESAE